MKHHTPSFTRRNVKAYAAAVLSYLLLAGQMTPLVLAASPTAPRSPAPPTDVARESAGEAPRLAAAPAPLAAPAPVAFAPMLTATKADTYAGQPSPAVPGTTITYTITITNTGDQPATNVTLNDTVDPNTSIVGGSTTSTPIGADDTYNVIGNVRIQPNAAAGLLVNDNDPNTGNTSQLTATAETKSSTQCTGGCSNNVTINADGSFSYNPPAGFNGTDTFTYTVNNANGSDTASVTLNVGNGAGGTTGVIWFIDDSASPGGDGRLTNPFNCFVGTGCFSDTAADEAGDTIFFYDGTYTAGYTLLNNQKVVGQDASASLATIAGVTVQTYSDALPATDSMPGGVTLTTTAPSTSALTLGQNNTLRGYTGGNTTGADINGSNYGTLTVGNNVTPDVQLNGTGQAMLLANGAFDPSSAFISVSSTSSASTGVNISQTSGTVAFGSTTVTNSTNNGIVYGQSTVNINFGDVSVTNGGACFVGIDNSAGTRTVGNITLNTCSGVGISNSLGGGTLNVTGTTTITNTVGNGIDFDSLNANITFSGPVTVNKNASSGIGVDISNMGANNVSFQSLTVTTSNGIGMRLNTSTTGTLSNTGGSLTTTGSSATMTATNMVLNLTFTSVSNNGGANGLTFSGGSGSFTSGTTNLQNNGGIGLSMSSSGVAANFGNTTVNSSAGDAVDLSSNTGNITFADLDLTPDTNLRGLDAQNNTGTITSTSGDIAAFNAAAVFIDGPAGRTPLAMVLNNVDSTDSTAEGVSLVDVSGNFTVNDATLATNIMNPATNGITVQNSASGTINFGNTSVTGSGGTGVALGTTTVNAGNVSFADLDITPDTGQRAFHAGANTGTINTTSGTIAAVNAIAVQVVGTSSASRSPLNMTLTSVSATASGGNPANGIVLTNVNGPSTAVGFSIIGDNANTTRGGNATGGTISNTTGATGASGGIGVRLENADEVALRRMQLNDHPNFALYALGASNVTVAFTTINGANGSADGVSGTFFTDEAAVLFANMTGAALVDRSKISGGIENNMTVVNDTGTLNRLVIDDCEFGLNNTTLGADSLLVVASGLAANPASTVNVTIEDSDFLGARGDVIQTDFRENGKLDLIMERNDISNAHTNVVAAGGGSTFAGNGNALAGGVPNFTYNIGGATAGNGNTFRGAKGTCVALDMGTGLTSGRFRNNTIGVQATANSASTEAGGFAYIVDPGGTNTVLVDNNQIFQYNNHGILLQVGDIMGQPTNVNMTVTRNVVNTPGTLLDNFNAIHLNHGTVGTDNMTSCVDIGGAGVGNSVANGGKGAVLPNASDIRLRQRQATTVRLPGYGGANNDNTAVANYLVGRNTTRAQTMPGIGPGAGASNTVGGMPAGGGFIGGAACTQPSNPSAPVEFVSELAPGVPPPAEWSGPAPALGGIVVAPTNGDNVTSRPFVSPMRLVRAKAAQPVVQQQQGASAAKAAPIQNKKSAPASNSKVAAPAQGGQGSPVRRGGGPTKSSGDAPTMNPPVIMGDNITWNIGTLPAGQSVTITFQVTIDNPFLGAMPQVSNQGTVTADGGISVQTDDPSEGGAADPTVTPVLVTNIFVRDAKVGEPTSGTIDMVFTVALSSPATGPVSVSFTTADGGSNPATGGTCPPSGSGDYSPTSGTADFSTGQQLKTINVPICSDAVTEMDETLLVNLTGTTAGTIIDNQATGTITVADPPGTTLISELRSFGPGMSNDPADDYVEIYNNTDSPVTVAASDSSAGWGVFAMGADCNATPVLLGTIPNSTVIPARGHYLLTGSAYSLANYGGTGAATGNLTFANAYGTNANVAVFSTSDLINISTVNRLDAVGFGTNTGSVCDLLREGSTTAGPTMNQTLLGQWAILRDPCGKQGNPNVGGLCPTTGNPKDSNNNSADFFMVDPNGTNAGAAQHLGAAGPENLASPLRRDSTIAIALLDSSKAAPAVPNRVRDFTSDPMNNSTFGTLSIRRRFTNNTGGNVTRLRFRIVDISTEGGRNPGTADLRAITSMDIAVGGVLDPVTCNAEPGSPAPPCIVTVRGTTLETPPTQPEGGGFNSTLSAGTITMGTPLANNASINLQFLLGIEQPGTFKFYFIIEALP